MECGNYWILLQGDALNLSAVQFDHFGAFHHITWVNLWLKTRSFYFRTGVTHVLAKFPESRLAVADHG
jgi:hypothetical protein